ncbi:MAG: hypothetical protein A2Y41_07775 [Spirochaetes bacterium GWB1_36_13]|nr:MAG: hypothetical protein A2Y41_07775 [Spirochaetes bacterium GWB1_36_13]
MKKIVLLFVFFLFSGCVKEDKGIISNFYSYPNPFNSATQTATFRVNYSTSGISEYKWKLEIFSENGNLVSVYENSSSSVSNPLQIEWNARDNRGNLVQNGIYTAVITLEITKTTGGFSGSVYRAYCKTVVQ